MRKINVYFINQNKNIVVDEGMTVSDACDKAGYSLNMVCGGKGTCGKCKVTIEINNIKSTVLACRTKIYDDIIVYLLKSNYRTEDSILESMEDNEFIFNPEVTKVYMDISTLNKNVSGQFIENEDIYILRKFSNFINDKECNGITFVYCKDKIIDIQSNNTSNYLYGAAVDLGTTTVVIYFFDLITGKLIKTVSDLNEQISVGSDVVSRIIYAQNIEGLNELNCKIIRTLNNMIDYAVSDIPRLKENLYKIVLCGNSAMQHLFFNLRPDRLGISPFVNITLDYIRCMASQISLNCNERCQIIFLPLLGAFVGADITSLLLTVKDDGKNRLILDLGTNGEIAAGNIDNYYVASTACGPALEGGNIECGMRACEGAIEKFRIYNDEVYFKVIGDSIPVGICGSGIIDITAELLRKNILDNTGRLISREEFKILRPKSKLYNKLKNINGINSFAISDENKEIYITQKDIRQIQLAKSAIYTGCMTLLKFLEGKHMKIHEIFLSGAFGNYINLDNAKYIGLIPNTDFKVGFVGNGAGKGVSMFLLNSEKMKIKCNRITRNTKHFELANDIYFTDNFIKNTNFINDL